MEGRTMPSTNGWPEPSAVYLVKVPDPAPPYDCQVYDCQVHGARCAVGAIGPQPVDPAVEPFGAAGPLPGVAGTHERTRSRGPRPGLESGAAPAGTTAAWPRQMAVAIVETLAGLRPDRQLVPLTTDRVRARIRSLAPFLRSDRRPRIARIVASRPTAGVVEMTVVVDFGPRSRALAMRFEHVPGRQATPGRPQRPPRWLCTAIEAG
jgi:hypothetical protein